jgi:hypothetical protein
MLIQGAGQRVPTIQTTGHSTTEEGGREAWTISTEEVKGQRGQEGPSGLQQAVDTEPERPVYSGP